MFIEEALGEPLTAGRIAQHAHLSPFHFQRLFVAHMGETVGGYVNSRRLEYAARLIEASPKQKMIAVALDCGFETHSAFSRAFRRHFGCTPSQFRDNPDQARRQRSLTRPYLLTQPADQPIPEPVMEDQPDMAFVYRTFTGTLNGSFFQGGASISRDLINGLVHEAGDRLMAVAGSFPDEPGQLNDTRVTGYFGGLVAKRYHSVWGEDWQSFPAGRWAVFEHYGRYQYLYQSWNRIYRSWATENETALRDEWPYESYLPDPDFSDNKRPTALIYVPVL
ncbi:helix-turn-helix domain-containing protein [Hoeflea prorocentri]|uniref:Helix-turn-helix domain-containing protein n=1 Tax=Hoeflea prorocentri TaxID=1922333 RepID=A0A9X3ZJB6_9HYPH|nr:helix-turn-helix domain-containing protein [Hoeflea prorocentri]MCY6383279.1 helix-turn-helix domain-containing protein [Hoeflea prorocentri]MDA5401079.1 helix-turn-helix domain-containing protein [Hoeflea prorocentri]